MWIDLADAEEIPSGEARSFQAGKIRILLVHSSVKWYALDDRCPHQERTLAGALVKPGSIECPWHSVEIDLGTGKILNSMGFLDLPPVACFPVREENGRIRVDLP